jgi:putative chitinase
MDINRLRGSVPDAVLAQIHEVMVKFQINTPLRLAHFLAQCGHESGGFRLVVENLNYSAQGLMKVFKNYFPTAAKAKQYERKPQAIANYVYANRNGNGIPASGDGWNFRGRGFIQLTGRANYAAFDAFVPENVIVEPDLVAFKYPLLSAAWFWGRNNLNSIADKGDSVAVITAVTKRVNGGTNGLPDRIAHFQKFYNLLK